MNKQNLRKWARDKRKGLDMVQISSVLTEKLVKKDEYKRAKNVMIFYPTLFEVNLLPLLKYESKIFYLPRIKDKELECCPYCIGDELVESQFHTSEPTCIACSKTSVDLVIVPALACDKDGYRLGYGGGFYDRFLKDFKGIKICCIPNELVVDTVFPEEHDIKMDLIITSK